MIYVLSYCRDYFSLALCIAVFFSVTVAADITEPAAQEKPIRALHLVTRLVTDSEMIAIIDKASDNAFNTLILGVAWRGSTKLDSMPWVENNDNTWSKENLKSMVTYAKSKGLDVIPHIPLLTKADKLFLTAHSDKMFNSKTYDPQNKDIYSLIYPIIDEVLEIFEPSAMHIGHDEVVGWTDKHYDKGLLKPGERQLPASLFLSDLLKLHAYLLDRGVVTWIWGDMLIGMKEFSMIQTGVNGNGNGYGKTLRGKVPKDIVIIDWHYISDDRGFPSLAAFLNDGFRTLGATWDDRKTIERFSNYAAEHAAAGMVATTWYYVYEKNLDHVDDIIIKSGNIFKTFFPDVKKASIQTNTINLQGIVNK